MRSYQASYSDRADGEESAYMLSGRVRMLGDSEVQALYDNVHRSIKNKIEKALPDNLDAAEYQERARALKAYYFKAATARCSPKDKSLKQLAQQPNAGIYREIKNLPDAVPLSLARQLVRMDYAPGAHNQRYDYIFGDEDRLYFDLITPGERDYKVYRKTQDHLNAHGYVVQDYKGGYAVDREGKQTYKIGKLLQDLDGEDLLEDFKDDPVRQELMVAVSRHPYDVGRMSTERAWYSCMNAKSGMYREKIPAQIRNGCLVAYLVSKNDPDIKDPHARITLYPYTNDGVTIFKPGLVYGRQAFAAGGSMQDFFEQTAHAICDDVLNFSAPDGDYGIVSNVYTDGMSIMFTCNQLQWTFKNVTETFMKDPHHRHRQIAEPLSQDITGQLVTDATKLGEMLHDPEYMSEWQKIFDLSTLMQNAVFNTQWLNHSDKLDRETINYASFKAVVENIDYIKQTYMSQFHSILESGAVGLDNAHNYRSGSDVTFASVIIGALGGAAGFAVSVTALPAAVSFGIYTLSFTTYATGLALGCYRGAQDLAINPVKHKLEENYQNNKKPGVLARLAHHQRQIWLPEKSAANIDCDNGRIQRVRPLKLEKQIDRVQQELDSFKHSRYKQITDQAESMKNELQAIFCREAKRLNYSDSDKQLHHLATIFAERVINAQHIEDIAAGRIFLPEGAEEPEAANDNASPAEDVIPEHRTRAPGNRLAHAVVEM